MEIDDARARTNSNTPRSIYLMGPSSSDGHCHHDLSSPYITSDEVPLEFWCYLLSTSQIGVSLATHATTGDWNTNEVLNFISFRGGGDIAYYYSGSWVDTGFDWTIGWHRVRMFHNFTLDSYYFYYDNTRIPASGYLNPKNSGLTSIRSIQLVLPGTGTKAWWDDIKIGDYYNSGNWQSAVQNIPSGSQLKDTTITFSGLSSGISKIDKIEWLVDGGVKAIYETDIENDAQSPFTITESDLTFGNFNDIVSNFNIKVHLSSDGTTSPVIEQIEGTSIFMQGDLISTPITIPTNNIWNTLTLNKTEPVGTEVKISVLDGNTIQPIDGFSELDATSIDLTPINPGDHPTIKLKADLTSLGTFTSQLHDWYVSYKPDPPKLASNIPSTRSFPEDTEANNLFNLANYFEDVWTSDDNLKFQIIHESDDTHIDAEIDGTYLDFTAPTVNWSGYETFRVKCTDEGGLSVNSNGFKVTVTEVNDAPEWTPIENIHILEDSTEEEIIDLDAKIKDSDDILENISYKLKSNNNEDNIFVQIVDRKVFVEPATENYVGSAIIKITADDGNAMANISFTIIIDPVNDKPIVELLSPGNNNIITTPTVKLSWTEGFDVDSTIMSYDVYLDEVSPPQTMVSNDQTVTSFTIQLEDGTYYWSVIPYDGVDEGDWDEANIWSFTITTEEDPLTPAPRITLRTPYNNSILNADSVELVWNTNNSFLGLEYFVYFDTEPIPNKLAASGISETEHNIINLIDGETYYWTVIPVSGSLMGICSDGVWSFTVQLDFIPEYDVKITGSESLTLFQSESRFINLTVSNEGNVKDIFIPELDSGRLGTEVILYDSKNILLDPSDTALLPGRFPLSEEVTTGYYNISVIVSSFWGGNEVNTTHIILLKIEPRVIKTEPITEKDEIDYTIWIVLIIVIVIILIVIALVIRKRQEKMDETLAAKGIAKPGTGGPALLPDIVSRPGGGAAPQLGAAGQPRRVTQLTGLQPSTVTTTPQRVSSQLVGPPSSSPQLPQYQPVAPIPTPTPTPSPTSPPSPTAVAQTEAGMHLNDKLKLLNERLLKGEIDQELYQKLRREFETTSKVNFPVGQPKLPPAQVQQQSTKKTSNQ
jgi:uncharacterized membrane protein